MMHGYKMWSDEQIETLRTLAAAGKSAALIGNELGFTRSAVCGKVARLGLKLTGRPKDHVRVEKHRRGRSETTNPLGPNLARLGKKILADRTRITKQNHVTIVSDPAFEEEAHPADAEIPIEQRCQISQLTNFNCHWPVGDPLERDFFFCGGLALGESPYCPHHHGRARATARIAQC